MAGLGTIVNVLAIIAGGLIGMIGGRALNERMQESLMSGCGIVTIFLGAGGALAKMLKMEDGVLTTDGTMMMIVCLLVGTLIGEYLDIDGKMEQFGEWIKKRTGNEKDATFTNAFVTASLTVCIGAMAIVGSIQDGIYGDHSVLFTKAVLDFMIIIPMTASLGKGAAFSAISVGLAQGIMTILASMIAPVMTDAAMHNLSYLGNILIFCVGLNLLFPRKVRVANMLPALLAAVIWAFVF